MNNTDNCLHLNVLYHRGVSGGNDCNGYDDGFEGYYYCEDCHRKEYLNSEIKELSITYHKNINFALFSKSKLG